jgi:hypothetical protein
MIARKSLTMNTRIGAEMKYAGRACEPYAMRESCWYQDNFLPPPSLPHFQVRKMGEEQLLIKFSFLPPPSLPHFQVRKMGEEQLLMEFSFLSPPGLPHFHPTKNVGQAAGKWGRSNCSWNSTSCPLPASPIFESGKWGRSNCSWNSPSCPLPAGKLLDIDVLDHMVIGQGSRWVSLKERGLGLSA